MRKFILLVLFLTTSSFAQIEEFTLDNGLKIIVKEVHKAPIFLSQVWYKVGASDEPEGVTGISHMFEHMMFKGTEKYPVGEFTKIIAKNGGQDNAFTSKDYTAYYQKMAKGKLDVALELEADRMVNLQLSDSEFQKERDVVAEERRLRVEDNPNAILREQFNKNFYSNPYQRPIIGWMKDIESYNVQKLDNWYKQWYIPKNAIIVVVGDVDAQDVFKKVKRYFGNIKNPKAKKFAVVKIEKHLRKKHQILKKKAKLPYYIMAYDAPTFLTTKNEKEIYALEFLSYLLDKQLEKKLIRQQNIASSIGISYNLYDKYDTAFAFSFVPALNKSVKTIRGEITNHIKKLQTTLTSPKELKKFKTQAEASFVYEQDSISSQAYYLGALEATGLGWQKSQEYLKKLNLVTAQEIQDVAKKYLKQDTLISSELIPQKL